MTTTEDDLDVPGIAPAVAEAMMHNPNGVDSYRGRPVTAVSVAIRNTGDGLSKAMEIRPQVYEFGDRVMVLLEAEVTHHDHAPVPKSDGVELKLVLRAETAMIVDDKASESKLRKMRDRIARHEEAKQNVSRLDGMDADDLEKTEEEETDGDD